MEEGKRDSRASAKEVLQKAIVGSTPRIESESLRALAEILELEAKPAS